MDWCIHRRDIIRGWEIMRYKSLSSRVLSTVDGWSKMYGQWWMSFDLPSLGHKQLIQANGTCKRISRFCFSLWMCMYRHGRLRNFGSVRSNTQWITCPVVADVSLCMPLTVVDAEPESPSHNVSPSACRLPEEIAGVMARISLFRVPVWLDTKATNLLSMWPEVATYNGNQYTAYSLLTNHTGGGW